MWPASYFGPVQWAAGGNTLRLVDTGVTLDVSGDTDITLDGGAGINADYVRSRQSGQNRPFLAQVIYRPYLRPKGPGGAVGFAQAIAER